MPPVTGKGPDDLWPDCWGDAGPHLGFPSASTLSDPSRGGGRTLLRRGSGFQKTEMKEPPESNNLVQWPILFCTILRTDLSLAFQTVASRILTHQNPGEKSQQMVRPLGRKDGSWWQKSKWFCLSLSPQISLKYGGTGPHWAFALTDIGSLVLCWAWETESGQELV